MGKAIHTRIATAMLLIVGMAGCGQTTGDDPAVATASDVPGEPVMDVVPSARALAELEQRGETITVSASWYGDPVPAALSQVDETGRLAPGRREWSLPARGGRVVLAPDAGTRAAFAGIAGPVSINVNVYSSRLSGPDNLLACDFIDGEVGVVAATPRTLRCGLIEESPQTHAYP